MLKFRLFSEKPLTYFYVNPMKNAITNHFRALSEEKLNEITKDDLNNLKEQFKIIIPELRYDDVRKKVEEQGLNDLYVFKIPFMGDNPEYFKLNPNEGLMWTYEVYVEGQNLCFEMENCDIEEMKRTYNTIIEKIKTRFKDVNKVITPANKELKQFVQDEYNRRKAIFLDRKKKTEALGF
jgi:hypothetical protein